MDSPMAERKIEQLLASYCQAVTRRDVDAVVAMFDEDVLGIGTGEDEWYEGREAIRRGLERDFGQSSGLTVSVESSSARAKGAVGWVGARVRVAADLDGQAVEIHARLTATLRHDEARWLFVQSHLSVPSGEQSAGESFPAGSVPASRPDS